MNSAKHEFLMREPVSGKGDGVKRDPIDFHQVAPEHLDMHARLENWARWSRNRGKGETAPGFALYQSPARARAQYGAASAETIDRLDAAKIAAAVSALPVPHAGALSWCYVLRDSPATARRRLATTYDGLMLLVRDGRQMLINRGV